MDRRVLLALVLSAAVVVLTQILFPPPKRAVPRTAADSAAAGLARPLDTTRGAAATAPGTATATPGATTGVRTARGDSAVTTAVGVVPAVTVETTTVATTKTRYRFSSVGAAPIGAELAEYSALMGNGKRTAKRVELVGPGDALLRFRLVVPGDTLELDQTPFAAQRTAAPGGGERLDYTAALPSGVRVAIRYTFAPDSYLVRVSGRVENAPQPAFLLVDMPRAVASAEADTLDDRRHRAVAYKLEKGDAAGLQYPKLKDTVTVVPGPITWAVSKSKYFLVGLLAPKGGAAFREIQVQPTKGTVSSGFFGQSYVATEARATVIEPLAADGTFGFELYAGPQEFHRLEALGRDFENSNPYGGWLQGVVQPFATIVIRTLLWMKNNLHLSYGWILVLFGIAVRLAMWPFQQSAMRSSLKMQRLQPEMQRLQEKHRADPQKLQTEMMKLYKEHDMSPFSTLSGCLPMLLPMPIFFALFFVFQNTIEFRGVPFLWLTDISLHDPLFIMPVVMGLSSYLLAWIGLRNAPPNPQAKMTSYLFPAVMTFALWKFASGLNLYYTVQNIAALPQQWLIAKERGKQGK